MGATIELLAGVVAIPAGDVDDGVKDLRFLLLPCLGVSGGVLLGDLDPATHGNVFVDHDPTVVVHVVQGEDLPGISVRGTTPGYAGIFYESCLQFDNRQAFY